MERNKLIMHHYLECPNRNEDLDFNRSIFLAGSITGAYNWQDEMKTLLLPHLNVVNPRRSDFDVTAKDVERFQITWEHEMLRRCKYILFWFSYETFAPITLFELGAALNYYKLYPEQEIFIGIHPDYKRKNDVIIQTELVDKELSQRIVFDRTELAKLVISSI